MHPFSQRSTRDRSSAMNPSPPPRAQEKEKRSNVVVNVNPECDCPKCRRAARSLGLGNGAIGINNTSKMSATTTRFYGPASRSKSPVSTEYKAQSFPVKSSTNTKANYGDGDRNRNGQQEVQKQNPSITLPAKNKDNDSATKFVLTPRKMVYTPPPPPQRTKTEEFGNGDCQHTAREPCCVYCRAKLSGNGGKNKNNGSIWTPAASPRAPLDRKRTAVISRARALQPAYSTPTCTCFHEMDDEEETPRLGKYDMEEPEQEQYDEDEDESEEVLIKPEPRLLPPQNNPIRDRFRLLQQQESRVRRIPIPSRYMTDLQTRITKSTNIYVYRNGIESLPPALIHIPPSRKQNMRQVMLVIQDRMKYPIGYAKTLYKMDGTLVRHPCELELYEKYVVASSYQKCFKSVDYGRVRSPLMVLGSESKNIHVRNKKNSYEDWKRKWKQHGLGKCPLPAEESRSREHIEKPQSLRNCIPVKLPEPTPRLSLLQNSTRDEDMKPPPNPKISDNSASHLGQTKSEPLNLWGGRSSNGAGIRVQAVSSTTKQGQDKNDNSGDESWADEYFAIPKRETRVENNNNDHYPRQKPRILAPAPEPEKVELIEDMTEPELVDDESAREPQPRNSKPFSLDRPNMIPTTDFQNFQSQYQMQYVPATWLQLPVADPTYPRRGRMVESKSTSTSDIPRAQFGTGSRTHLQARLDSAQRMLREIPEIQIPFTPPAAHKYNPPVYNRLQELESRSSAAANWKPPPAPVRQAPTKRNVAIQMGVSSFAEDRHIYSQENIYGLKNHMHPSPQYMGSQVVLLVPQQQDQSIQQPQQRGYFK